MKRLFPVTLLLLSQISFAQQPLGQATQSSSMETMAVGNIIQMTLGLIVVVLLIFGCAWLVKRFGRMQGGLSDQLKVISGLPVGTRERVVLLQVGDKQILLGITPHTIQTLHVLEEPIAPHQDAAPNFLRSRFSEILKKQTRQ